MGKIALEGMEFFAHHGFTDEEQLTGNKYSVDICIETNLSSPSESDQLEDTIDYSQVYQIVSEQMKIKSRLLEHVGHRIIGEIKSKFPQAQAATIQVSKFNPPVGGIVYKSKIILEERF